MIDIHSHIIFNIDDGAASLDESVTLCCQAADNGFDAIVATPHFTDYRNIERFVWERDSKLDLIRERLHEEQIDITLYSGAELYLSRGVFTAGDLDELTINNSRYMLCEFSLGPFNVRSGLEMLSELTLRGYVPIVAHPERYFEIRRNREIIDQLIYKGVIFQVNADSLAGNLDDEAQDIAIELIHDGTAKFIASDAHDIYRRNMNFREKISSFPSEITQSEANDCFIKYPQAVINDKDIF